MKLFSSIAAVAVIGATCVAALPASAQFLDPNTGVITDQFGIIQDIDPGAVLDHQLALPSERRYMDDWGAIRDGNGMMIDGPDPSRAPLF